MHAIMRPNTIVRFRGITLFAVITAAAPLLVVAKTLALSSSPAATGGFGAALTQIAVAATTLKISGTPAKVAVIERAYEFTPKATGAAGGTLSFSISDKPDWATFSIATGALVGRPTAAQEGIYRDIVISVSNGKAKASLAPFAIEVSTAATAAPTIGGTPAKSAVVGQAYAFIPNVSVPAGKSATFAITNKPNWAAFSAASGKLSGTPAAVNVGTDSDIIISVSDGVAKAALPAFAIDVAAVGNKSITLSWKAPTENSNGTALTNLAGYRIYWGTSSSALSHTITINSVGVTSEVVSGLGSGTYYFALMSYNSVGVESKLSNVVSKTE
jgi:hypothetical protein